MQVDQSRPIPQRPRRRAAPAAVWWDERRPGGRARSVLFLAHPGPSVLVTIVFVAVAALAGRSVPDPARVLQLAGMMLPIQFAIGVINDVGDLQDDTAGKPWKPLPRGTVSRRAAAVAGALLGAAGLAVAATINLATLGLGAAGLGAGVAYDLGLRRTPVSWIPWWGGIALLPLAAYASVVAIPVRLILLVPFAGLAALGLHLANAAPDIDADRAAGRRSLPVLLGAEPTRRLQVAALSMLGVLAAAFAAPVGQDPLWVLGGVALLLAVVAVTSLARVERPFPALAVAVAVFAVIWLATLPR